MSRQACASDIYLLATINRHRSLSDDPRPNQLRRQLTPILRQWSLSRHVEAIQISGSQAKSTALSDSDLDLFLSLSPSTPRSVADIQSSLHDHFRAHLPLIRNVSVRIMFEGAGIDLVPARRREDSTHHTLWQSRDNTWIQTDITEQTRYVRESGLLNEILALKIWRRRRALRFPSFLMELATIHALTPNASISESFMSLLEFLSTDFLTTRLIDPANSNNVVSDLLTPEEKSRIAQAARTCLTARSWLDIV